MLQQVWIGVGDIAYYAPWGNLTIFYKRFKYSRGLAKLGTLDSSVRAFERPNAGDQLSSWASPMRTPSGPRM